VFSWLYATTLLQWNGALQIILMDLLLDYRNMKFHWFRHQKEAEFQSLPRLR
jgi:hypothetical protein